MLSEKTDILN